MMDQDRCTFGGSGRVELTSQKYLKYFLRTAFLDFLRSAPHCKRTGLNIASISNGPHVISSEVLVDFTNPPRPGFSLSAVFVSANGSDRIKAGVLKSVI